MSDGKLYYLGYRQMIDGVSRAQAEAEWEAMGDRERARYEECGASFLAACRRAAVERN